jgi:hypothetical protein
MYRFTIRDVLWLTFGVACVLTMWWWSQRPKHEPEVKVYTVEEYVRGEGADAPHAPDVERAANPARADAPPIVTTEQATAIVRSLALRPGDQAEFKCEEFPEEYRIFVQFFVLDEEGNRSYYAGGHAVYILDKSGRVVRTIKGL